MAFNQKKTTLNFRIFLTSFAPEYPIKKGYVAALFWKGKKKVLLGTVQKKIAALVPKVPDKCIWDKDLEANLFTFNRQLTILLKEVSKQWDMLVELCNEIFQIKFKELPAVVSLQATQLPLPPQPSALQVPPSTISPPHTAALALLSLSQQSVTEAPSTSCFSDRSNPKRLRCELCAGRLHKFKKVHAHLRKKLKEERERHTLEMETNSSIVGAHNISKRKDDSMLLWKTKYFDLLATSTNGAKETGGSSTSLDGLKKENSDLSEKLRERDNTLQKTMVVVQSLKQDNVMLFHEVDKLKKGIAILSKTNEKLKKDQEKNPGEYLQNVSSTSAAKSTSTAQSVPKLKTECSTSSLKHNVQVPIFFVRLNPPPPSHHLKPQVLATLDANEKSFN